LLAAAHEMIAGSTLFPHRGVNKVTCKSPEQDMFNQIVF